MQLQHWHTLARQRGLSSTASGNVFVVEDFFLPQLRRKRRLWVYLPPDYFTTTQRYPVLYMHDGQNLFDAATAFAGEWGADKTLDRLFYERAFPGLIVVGIENGGSKRVEEYIPQQRGLSHAAFLTDTLKPAIDRSLRTLPHRESTGIAGSSLGALISLHSGLTRQDIFSKIGAFSPAMFFADPTLSQVKKHQPMSIHLDVGTKETLSYTGAKKYADQVWDSYYHLLNAGFDNHEVRFVVEKDAPHQESAWGARFAEAVLWLYGRCN